MERKVSDVEQATTGADEGHLVGAHFPLKEGLEPKGKWARADDTCHGTNADEHAAIVTFSKDIGDALFPTQYEVRGLLPAPKRDADGTLVRDRDDKVVLTPRFNRTRIRGARWIDEVILSVAQLLPYRQGQVLMALHAMTNALKYDDIVPFAHFDDEKMKIVADDGRDDDTCGYSVPTLCIRIPDLSFANVSRFLHPDRSVLLDQLREDAERSDLTFDTDRAEKLLRIDEIDEAEFWAIIDDLMNIGILAVLDQDGTRIGLLNHVSMAQCSPSMRLTMLQAVDSYVTHPVDRSADHTVSGIKKPESKRSRHGKRALRERISELLALNKRKDRAMKMVEQHHAEDHATWHAERSTLIAKRDDAIAQTAVKDARIAELERALQFEHGEQVADASDAEAQERMRG